MGSFSKPVNRPLPKSISSSPDRSAQSIDARDPAAPPLTIGIVADTHVPDRARALNPQIQDIFKENHVELILHAGDICNHEVLGSLEKVAPVKAVRGNRDWFFAPPLPMLYEMNLGGIPILLLHGHANPIHYISDKIDHTLRGYRFARYENFLGENFPQYRVYVFGHSHAAENRLVDGRLFFNPGSASVPWQKGSLPSVGVLRIYSDGSVEGKINALKGWRLMNKEWVQASSSDDRKS